MALNSLQFIAFVGVVALVFFLVPRTFRWLVIIAASYYFYATWAPIPAVLGVLGLTLATFACGIGMARYPAYRKAICAAGLTISLGALVLLKYLEFFVGELYGVLSVFGVEQLDPAAIDLPWYLPVGYSFITFSIASYLIDVYRGRFAAETHLGSFAAYVAFFPKILAGPIERAAHFLPQWWQRFQFDPVKANEGVQLILWGLFKKVVIADRLAVFVDGAFATPAFATPVELIVAIYFYSFQIYCDFSGYTDIAIGVFKILGFDLAPNFKRPYLSRSIPEFWGSRWHITLGSWFRDYLYIPLGGSRVARWRLFTNLMIVFVVSGLWHAGMVGAAVSWTFLAWGALNGVYQVCSVGTAPYFKQLAARFPRLGRVSAVPGIAFLQGLAIFHLITFSWIFFRANTLTDAWTVMSRIYGNLDRLPLLISFYNYQDFEFIISIVLILLLLVVEIFDDRKAVWERLIPAPIHLRWPIYAVIGVLLIVLGKWEETVFIYMQF